LAEDVEEAVEGKVVVVVVVKLVAGELVRRAEVVMVKVEKMWHHKLGAKVVMVKVEKMWYIKTNQLLALAMGQVLVEVRVLEKVVQGAHAMKKSRLLVLKIMIFSLTLLANLHVLVPPTKMAWMHPPWTNS